MLPEPQVPKPLEKDTTHEDLVANIDRERREKQARREAFAAALKEKKS